MRRKEEAVRRDFKKKDYDITTHQLIEDHCI